MFLVFCFVAAILVAWVLLMVSGWLSLRWSRRIPERRSALRLVLAVVPVLVGLFLFRFHLRWTMNNVTVNLSWPFVIPISIGVFAIVVAVRRRG
jgi:energy-coupling factor transporter transmembrane protein EcfT